MGRGVQQFRMKAELVKLGLGLITLSAFRTRTIVRSNGSLTGSTQALLMKLETMLV